MEGGKEGGANRMLLRQIVVTGTFISHLSFLKKSAQEIGGGRVFDRERERESRESGTKFL